MSYCVRVHVHLAKTLFQVKVKENVTTVKISSGIYYLLPNILTKATHFRPALFSVCLKIKQ